MPFCMKITILFESSVFPTSESGNLRYFPTAQGSQPTFNGSCLLLLLLLLL